MLVVFRDLRPLLRQMVEHLEDGWFGLAERSLREGGIRVLRTAMEKLLEGVEEKPLPRNSRCPSRGEGRVRSQSKCPKLLDTTLGWVSICRRRYDCDNGLCAESGCHPCDLELGAIRDRTSPEMRRLVGLLSKEIRYAMASKLFTNMFGVKCNTKKMQRLSTSLGEAMEADRVAHEPEAPFDPPPPPAVIHGATDGTGVPVRGSETDVRRSEMLVQCHTRNS